MVKDSYSQDKPTTEPLEVLALLLVMVELGLDQ
jgi:hypothetical protein